MNQECGEESAKEKKEGLDGAELDFELTPSQDWRQVANETFLCYKFL